MLKGEKMGRWLERREYKRKLNVGIELRKRKRKGRRKNGKGII